ncbi:MAG: hypothetical protein KAJ78_05305 [Acidobacteria bacterium]|nr:hypothetical protein [Acidobacteriota bacterium]
MGASPLHLDLTLRPRTRFDAIDVVQTVDEQFGNVLDGHRRVLYCSHHTTAGFFDAHTAKRFRHQRNRMEPFVDSFRSLFPQHAGYRHDAMELRSELTEDQRKVEPPNADAHLAFIGAGLKNCVTYDHHPNHPVYFMELDGEHQGRFRSRTATLLAYDKEVSVITETFTVPVSHHAIASVNIADPRLGLFEHIESLIARHGFPYGRVDIALAGGEQASAVTVNEFETLLMRHDLEEVLRDPLRFVMRQGRRALADPRMVPAKSRGYAKYDLVQIINLMMDALGLSESAVERLVARLMGYPAQRLLRFKRSISFPVGPGDNGGPRIIRGRYQSPILIQWRPAPGQQRELTLRLTRFRGADAIA